MSKKLEKNGLWESSRMVLPQHKEASLMQERNSRILEKPNLTEEEKESIFYLLQSAKGSCLQVKVSVVRKFEIEQLVGNVSKLESMNMRLEISEDNFEWIKYDDIWTADFLN